MEVEALGETSNSNLSAKPLNSKSWKKRPNSVRFTQQAGLRVAQEDPTFESCCAWQQGNSRRDIGSNTEIPETASFSGVNGQAVNERRLVEKQVTMY